MMRVMVTEDHDSDIVIYRVIYRVIHDRSTVHIIHDSCNANHDLPPVDCTYKNHLELSESKNHHMNK